MTRRQIVRKLYEGVAEIAHLAARLERERDGLYETVQEIAIRENELRSAAARRAKQRLREELRWEAKQNGREFMA